MGPSRMITNKPVIAAISGYAVAGQTNAQFQVDITHTHTHTHTHAHTN